MFKDKKPLCHHYHHFVKKYLIAKMKMRAHNKSQDYMKNGVDPTRYFGIATMVLTE